MNIGTIITRALNRANLAVGDIGFREMALEMLDEVIQEHWNYKNWKFRQVPLTLATVVNQEEYALSKKVASVNEIVPNGFRGTSPYRVIDYIPSHEFHRTRTFDPQYGDPYKFTESQIKQYSTNPSAASVITAVSSQANYATGTATVVNGSRQVIFAGSAMTVDMLGRWVKFGTDVRNYRLVKMDSATIFYLDSAYEGSDSSSATFSIGDINQKVTVLGYVSGSLVEEELSLNGATPVVGSKSFTSLVRISKSARTAGYITCTSNAGAVSNIVLDPGETECDFVCVKLYPIPDAIETLNYEAYIRHPYLSKESDSPLFPSQFHTLLQLELQIKLESEWHKQDVSQLMLTRRDGLLRRMEEIDNSVDGWTIYQESDESTDRSKIQGLPPSYGSEDDF
jgi:hypothetical protein